MQGCPFIRIPAAAISVLQLCTPGGANSEPLFDQDSGPLTGLFGWPNSTEGGRLAAAGANVWALHVATASHSVAESRGGESITLDGETTRIWFDWRRGISGRLEAGVSLPWVWHESGRLDSLISGWHDFFGLPDGNRGAWQEDRLLFEYTNGADESLRLDHHSNGPGDLRLYGGWLLGDSPRNRLALRAGLKLPTGDSAKLLGSGAADVSIGLAADVTEVWNVEELTGFWRLSAVRLGTPEVLPARSRNWAGQLSAGLDYRWTPSVSVTAQTLLHSAAFDAAVAPLGERAMSLTVGAGFRLPGGYRLSLAVTEDIRVESIPDVTFLLTVSAAGR